MVRSKEQAQEDFGPYVERLRACVVDAVEEYYTGSEYAALRLVHTKRTAASTVHDLCWKNLRDEFEDERSFIFTEVTGRRLMHLGDQWRLRVKKLDKNIRPSNHPTQLVLDFLEQLAYPLPGLNAPTAYPLPGLNVPTNVDLGYGLVGPAEIEPIVYFRCPKDLTNQHWLWQLDAGEAVAVPTAEPAPTEPRTEVEPRRVRPREIDLEEVANQASAE